MWNICLWQKCIKLVSALCKEKGRKIKGEYIMEEKVLIKSSQ